MFPTTLHYPPLPYTTLQRTAVPRSEEKVRKAMEDLESFFMSIANGETSFFHNQSQSQGGYSQGGFTQGGYNQGAMTTTSSSSSTSGNSTANANANASASIASVSMGMLVDKDAAKHLQNCVTVLTAEEVGWIDVGFIFYFCGCCCCCCFLLLD